MVQLQSFDTKNGAAYGAVDWFVKRVKKTITEKDGCRVVLPTGGSPAAFYEILTTEYADACDWSLVEWITLDELLGINQRHKATFFSALQETIWRPLRVGPINILALNPEPWGSPQDECGRFTLLSSDADIVILGVGADGHIGMNFPPAAADCQCHVLDLPEDALPAAELFEDGEKRPTKGITMGISEILSGKSILLLVDGAKKAQALDQLLNGEISDAWPVTHLRNHQEVRVFATKDALL